MMSKLTNWYTDILILFIFFCILFFSFLGGHHLISPDETRYVGIAWEMFHNNNYITPTIASSPFLGKPILFYWLEILAFKCFGVSELSARLFPALLGVITTLITYSFGRIVFNRQTGIIASLIVASSPLYFALAHYANMDGEVASFLTCSLLCFYIGIHKINNQQQTSLWFYSAYIISALAFLTKGLIGLVFPIAIVFFWLAITSNWKILLRVKLLQGIILIAIIITPWLYLCEQQNPGFLYYFFIWNQFFRFVGDDFNQQQPWFYYLPLVLVGVFPFTLYLLQILHHHIKNIFTNVKSTSPEIFLLIWLIFITLFFSIPKSKLVGYIGPALPPISILIAIYLVKKWEELPSKTNTISTFIVIIVFLSLAIVLPLLAIVIPQQEGIMETQPYAIFLSILLFISSILLCLSLYKKLKFGSIITILIATVLILNITLISSLKYWSLQWNWPIAKYSKIYKTKHPNIKIFMFGHYYYAIPMYLNQIVPTVSNWNDINRAKLSDNWQREIYEGLKYYHKDLPPTLVNYAQFKKEWQLNSSVLVIVNNSSLTKLNSLISSTSYHIVARVPSRHVTIIEKN
jgi:4-amino-4-deoxy-L-arabinose transferase-like glycosyltransferase